MVDNVTLTFEENSDVYFFPDMKLVNDIGTLNIENNCFMHGDTTTSWIYANMGSTNNFGIGTVFSGTDDVVDPNHAGWWGGFVSLNNNLDFRNVSFNKAILLGNSNRNVTLFNCEFDRSAAYFQYNIGNIVIDSCSFIHSGFLGGTQGYPDLDITNCFFSGPIEINYVYWLNNGIFISGYENANISNNTISGYYSGIDMSYCRTSSSPSELKGISENIIYNNSYSGLTLYNSIANMSKNYIYNNQVGLELLNNSSVALYGNPSAQNEHETNYITDNSRFEIYATTGSFPWYFHYNVIVDDDNLGNPNDPMVYYQPPGGGFTLLDVRYNCWGNGFDQTEDLYPSGYIVNPTQCPGGGGHKSIEIALDDFLEGLDYFENEQYADAKTSFESVIQQYPKTQYAEAAMKELFSLEKFADNDYSTLQQYYQTNDSIQADTVLTKLAIFLSNKCEIELQNWQTAIDHYEDIIENPESPEDSIFAIIDLGYTYLLMGDSGYKSTAQGRLLEHKPASPEAFSSKRDYLISLLPFEKSGSTSETLTDMNKQGELLQNIPNPFSNTTSIQFNLNSGEFTSVEIRVHDQVGKEVMHITVNSAKEGSNTVELNMQGLPSGIYYYSLIVNGTQADTKKMVVVR